MSRLHASSTRVFAVALRTALASLGEGATTAQSLEDFPTLTDDDVRAAIACAAPSAQ